MSYKEEALNPHNKFVLKDVEFRVTLLILLLILCKLLINLIY